MKELNCYAETSDGLVRLNIKKDGEDITVYENDVLRDDFYLFADLLEAYNEVYYDSKEDYKKEKSKKFSNYFNGE